MIFRSPYTDIQIPETSLTSLVLQHSVRLADKPALIDGSTGRIVTYAQLAQSVRSVASSLAQRGLEKGDVFAIFSPNLPEYAVAMHAVGILGGITVPIYPLLTARELAGQLNEANAKYLLTVPQLMTTALAAIGETNVREIFVFGAAEKATPFASLLESDGQFPSIEIAPRTDLFALPFSSGTTGLPKCVMLTHYNMVANLCQMDKVSAISESDKVICVVPCAHLFGMHVIMNLSLSKGATVVTLPRFELEQFLQTLQDYHITRAPLVPAIVYALAFHPSIDNYDLSKLKRVHSGGAPLAASVARACAERLDCHMRYGYGQTEVSPLSHMSAEEDTEAGAGSVGYCLPNTECKVMDTETGAELGPNETGELWTRGPQVMKGYLNQPEATAATIDADGWLHTGDIGYADEDGHFYIVDRLKELIKYKGLQVAPAELEAVLLSHPAIADAAVIPFPDDEAGEIPKAFVVLKAEASAEEIMSFVAERVAPHKKIRRVEKIEQIPRSPAGKILRRLLVEREKS
ncbi:MAG TPA: AMP-binding protein [Pyrinomonadaceae bacterium]|jgi:acyl-CoA synthetase (AMP-forming)/AMP-acid ligase II